MAAGIPELLEDLGMLYPKEDSKRKARYGLRQDLILITLGVSYVMVNGYI